GGAGLLAGGGDVPVPERPVLQARGVLGAADPLHAEGALLHHAARPHRDVGIQLEVERRLEGAPGVGVPVEVADLVGTVVAAVAGPDAAVVHLAVQAVGGVIAGVHRADRLAGGVLAVLAEHRDRPRGERLARLLPALEIALDPHPAHLAGPEHVAAADPGNVVLRITRGDAGGAPGALR